MNTDCKFISFSMALLASQALAFEYARKGYHVTWSCCRKPDFSYVRVVIFHSKGEIISSSVAFAYSKVETFEKEGTYWTDIEFPCNE